MKKFLLQFEDSEMTNWLFDDAELLRLLFAELDEFPGRVTAGPIPRLNIVIEESRKGGAA